MKIIRWILVLPAAVAAYMIVSFLCSILRIIVIREDIGLIGYYSSLFMANLFSCMVCGAAFTITGLWVSPIKKSSISVVLIILSSILFFYYAYITCYSAESAWLGICSIVWNVFGILGAIYGSNYYLNEYERETEEKRINEEKAYNKSVEEYNETLREINRLKEISKKKSMLQRNRDYRKRKNLL